MQHGVPDPVDSAMRRNGALPSGSGNEVTGDYIPSDDEHLPSPEEGRVTPFAADYDSFGAITRREETPPTFAAAPFTPTVPGYEILEELGRGGMGIVYKARHLKLQRLVALKMVLPGCPLSAERLDRFLLEAQVVARFQHPHLVQIYDIGAHDGLPYLSLELVEGGSLKEKLKSGPKPVAETAALVELLAHTVEYAHRKAVVHRDLKPANVLLMPDGTPKIADFGLALQLDRVSALEEDSGIIGTPMYMAPEQAWGDSAAVGPRVDVYALGVILYEMLTGRPPFQAANRMQTLHLVRNQEPVPPRRLVPQVPADLELICLKCLKKDQAQRFGSAGELADELRRFRDGRPIKTRPAPPWELVWKWTRRQPAVAGLLAVSALAVVSLVLYLALQARLVASELREQQRVAQRRDGVQSRRLQAQEAVEHGRLEDAEGHLQAAFESVQAEPSLADLSAPLAALHEQVGRLQAARQQREAEQQEQQRVDHAYTKFLEHRDTALFHGMVFAGVDLATNVAATTAACRDALALHDQALAPAKQLSPQRRQDCRAACYELLLVWAEAVAQPQPGEKPQLDEALRLLDRAAGLNLEATSAYHLRRAGYLEQLKDAAGARREYDLAKAAHSERALDAFLRGVAHQQQGRLTEAAGDFVTALRDQPGHFWARYFLGVCNLQLQRPAQARDNFTACLSARQDFLWAYLLRGFAHGQLNEFRAADADYRRVLDLRPNPQALYGILVNQGVLNLRQAQLIGAATPLPTLPPLVAAFQGAAEVVRTNRLAAAADQLRKAIDLQPEQHPGQRYLALVLQQQDRLEEAAAAIDRAVRLSRAAPPLVQAQLLGQRARLQRQRGDLTAALDDLNASLHAFPTAEDHMERGRVLFALRRFPEAVTAFDAALKARSPEAEVHRWKSEAYLALRRDSDAVRSLDLYLEAGGRPGAEVYRLRGQCNVRLRRFPAALADYTLALGMKPDAATYTARGWVFLAKECLPLALQDFEDAIRLRADHAEAYTGRGLIRARLGRLTDAVADAEAALAPGRARTPRLLWNATHVYCQIVAQLDADRTSRPSGLRERCLDRGLATLREALTLVPTAERGAFWREYVAPDSLLNPLRGTAGFAALERQGKP